MGNVLRVLGRDFVRLLKTPAALIVVIVLVVLPSTYTWFNVVGFWNPYGNTANLRVCVVNEDAGATNDVMGQVQLGNQIVDQLHDNTQLGWAFTDYDTAMDEVKSGKAYAAFVIPSDFSGNVASLLTGDFHKPNIEYYVNEKGNPISPKITDVGSTTLDETINSTFVSTVSGVVADQLNAKLAQAQDKLTQAQADTVDQLGRASDALAGARGSISDMASEAQDVQGKVTDAQGALQTARDDAASLQDGLQQAADLSDTLQGSIMTFTGTAMPLLADGTLSLSQAAAQASTSVSGAASSLSKAQGAVDGAVERAQGIVDTNTSLVDQLTVVQQVLPPGAVADSLSQTIEKLTAQNNQAQRDLDNLSQLSTDVASTADAVSGSATTVNTAVQGALAASSGYQTQLFGSALPTVSSGISQVGSSALNLKAAIANQGVLIDQTSSVLDQLSGTLGTAAHALSQTDGVLAGLQGTVDTARTDVQALGTSTAINDLMDNGHIDAEKLAEFMQSPTQVTTEKLYPLNAYGSAMAPLFISLSLWVGTIMLAVILKLEVDNERVPGLTARQGFAARGLFFAVLASLQAIVCVTGCLYIGVQAVSVPAFYLTAIIMSLAYLSITYTLSSLLQHIGIGLCIILVFVQIPGATGLYPIEMTPAFFQTVYPAFPFTYGINALRETIAGFYGTQYAHYIGVLLTFMVVAAAVGLLARPHLTNLNRLVAREVEASDLLNGEKPELAPRRYRLAQMIDALASRHEFHAATVKAAGRFMRLYPKLKRGALVAGIVVPVLLTVGLSLTVGEKVVILTAWLIWVVVVIAFLLVVEYIRSGLERKVRLDSMSDDELRGHLAARGKVSVEPVTEPGAHAPRTSPSELVDIIDPSGKWGGHDA